MDTFIYTGAPSRIIFGKGKLEQTAIELRALGCSRALILSTHFQKDDAEVLANRLGESAVGVFSNAVMHTPVEVTELAMQQFVASGADSIIAYGGGSTIGLGKAIAWRNDAPQLVIPTTYAGSEVTDILGQTEKGVKTTIRDPKVRPETVIYDPALTLSLPTELSVTSGLNAMAHAVEALYAPDANPVTSILALEGLHALQSALPRIVAEPHDLDPRAEALYGSWLCGVVLGSVAMSLHHKLCHTIGGSFDTPHADTHAILIPHTVAYNQEASAHSLERASALFDGNLGLGLYRFAKQLGAPMALKDLGVGLNDLELIADLATTNPYENPREVTREGILNLLQNAWAGMPPA